MYKKKNAIHHFKKSNLSSSNTFGKKSKPTDKDSFIDFRDKPSSKSSSKVKRSHTNFQKKKSNQSFLKHDKITKEGMPIVSKIEVKNTQMPLNKYLAHSGICSRREAATHIKNGMVQVNGNIEKNPAYKVTKMDKVKYKSKDIVLQEKGIYILMNKPKGCICTVDDPNERKTVLDLIPEHTHDRIYPVGRLDRNSTGVLLLTNDGNLTQKLIHPSYEVKKIYHVKLNKPLSLRDFKVLNEGIMLEDGFVVPDMMAYQSDDKMELGIEIHSGRNRIIRRMFEHLGYDVKNLDRVMFADFTKKNLPRGQWRYLDEKEIIRLKIFYKNFAKKKQNN